VQSGVAGATKTGIVGTDQTKTVTFSLISATVCGAVVYHDYFKIGIVQPL
jgi:hypothetical protein